MNLSEIYHQFLDGLLNTGWLEGIAVLAGIASVWFSKKENIFVYPVGLINTVIYVFISVKAALYGEAAVNFYYTVMSIYGWYQWKQKDANQLRVVEISFSDKNWIRRQIIFFVAGFLILFYWLQFMKSQFAKDAIPWADAIASSSAFTAMWLMTKKKVESWWWWILTNLFAAPLYFVKGLTFTSVYYFLLLILAIMGLMSWTRKVKKMT